MKACWNELFALGMAQCSSIMNVGTILSAIINHLQTSLQEGRRGPLDYCSQTSRSSQLSVFYRETFSRASQTGHGAHLEDAGVLQQHAETLPRRLRVCLPKSHRALQSWYVNSCSSFHRNEAFVLTECVCVCVFCPRPPRHR